MMGIYLLYRGDKVTYVGQSVDIDKFINLSVFD